MSRAFKDAYFEDMRRSKFVFSPRGHGWKNYRDVEALYLGAIPLVDAVSLNQHAASPVWPDRLWLNSTYADMPVLRVTNWSAITPAFLEGIWADVSARRQRDFAAEDQALPRSSRSRNRDGSATHRREPMTNVGPEGVTIGSDLRQLYSPYWLGRILHVLDRCDSLESSQGAGAFPWWCRGEQGRSNGGRSIHNKELAELITDVEVS
jgi:hypothetical protein